MNCPLCQKYLSLLTTIEDLEVRVGGTLVPVSPDVDLMRCERGHVIEVTKGSGLIEGVILGENQKPISLGT